jgi:hypothetical protein
VQRRIQRAFINMQCIRDLVQIIRNLESMNRYSCC